MSERKFTRLKQSLSQTTGTAAKARETVSRELRQSTLSPGMDSQLSAIDADYERSLREWNADLKQKLRDACRSQESSASLTLSSDSNSSSESGTLTLPAKKNNNKNNKNNNNNKDNNKNNSFVHKNSNDVQNSTSAKEEPEKSTIDDKRDEKVNDETCDSSVITIERLDLDLATQFATPEDDIQVSYLVLLVFNFVFLIPCFHHLAY